MFTALHNALLFLLLASLETFVIGMGTGKLIRTRNGAASGNKTRIIVGISDDAGFDMAQRNDGQLSMYKQSDNITSMQKAENIKQNHEGDHVVVAISNAAHLDFTTQRSVPRSALTEVMKDKEASHCEDTPGWRNPVYGCSTYAALWCADGKARPAQEWTLGAIYHYPERNCCVCGKAPTFSCSCPNGVPISPCTSDGIQCSSCNVGYEMPSCRPVPCPRNSNGGNVASGCACDIGFKGHITAVSGGSSGECTPNQCVCEHGDAATGAGCPHDGETKCAGNCQDGYHLSGGLCIENECACDTGDGAKGTDCPNNGDVACSPGGCKRGYWFKATERVCEEKVCTCENGTPGTKDECPDHDTRKCVACDDGYAFSGDRKRCVESEAQEVGHVARAEGGKSLGKASAKTEGKTEAKTSSRKQMQSAGHRNGRLVWAMFVATAFLLK